MIGDLVVWIWDMFVYESVGLFCNIMRVYYGGQHRVTVVHRKISANQ